MALTECPDCSRQVSTLAATCPACGRPSDVPSADTGQRTYITPLGEVVIGAGALLLCLAYPGLLILFGLWLAIRLILSIGRSSRVPAPLAVLVLAAATLGLMYAMPNYAIVLAVLGVIAVASMAFMRVRANRTPIGATAGPS